MYDPFYQSTVKPLMFFCAAVLLFVSFCYCWVQTSVEIRFSRILSDFGSHFAPTLLRSGKIRDTFYSLRSPAPPQLVSPCTKSWFLV